MNLSREFLERCHHVLLGLHLGIFTKEEYLIEIATLIKLEELGILGRES